MGPAGSRSESMPPARNPERSPETSSTGLPFGVGIGIAIAIAAGVAIGGGLPGSNSEKVPAQIHDHDLADLILGRTIHKAFPAVLLLP